ncbi:chemotaxis protein CheV [Dasania sp. GY-MA-18]|uniref:Chemotaxis protein CheV n=1 Tax=Dasania phycosphaerae TaxID=2950436 RepID=A0A9J6RIC0_9GAMM|nr:MULTISPECIES: chemotaxis protein CheV [Dasania]MCR8921752.1 chemotaxis protein CheV [Dasania sp. GY-MA-18]MCZ0864180.1 chemotaxis protein CheV [Dasania phycosphaerae]MCZ0867908.1 chemotaxis protein CheV [Dasania phycosphaerae]
MSDLLKNVDSRTNLVGRNRLELLTFRLKGSQLFAINVFKVQEVQEIQKVPRFTSLPKSNPVVVGVTTVRGQTIPVIDLSLAIGRSAIPLDGNAAMIVTEYNRTLQAFVVGSVDRIVNLNWEEVMPPPAASGRDNFLTAITRVDGKIVEIIDVEKVLATVVNFDTHVSEEVLQQEVLEFAKGMEVLLVDDSRLAIEQASTTLRQLGLEVIVEMDGLKALRRLQSWRDQGIDVTKKLLMVITDAEMPEMDGYRLTTEIKRDPALKDLFVVLHTSLSGNFNHAMVKKVGCDGFLSKFQPDKLAEEVQERVKMLMQQ